MDTILAKRGYIYEWNKDDSTRLVLVLSNDTRSKDKLVSVLFLCDGEATGYDAIAVKLDDSPRYVHADLVTYTGRGYLTREVCEIDENTLSLIESHILQSLGVPDYKTMYNDLLTWVVKQS